MSFAGFPVSAAVAARRATSRGGASRTARAVRRLTRPATALTVCGATLLPWMAVLAGTLPTSAQAAHWRTAWVGFDALLALGLLGTGALVQRHDPRAPAAAGATAALLVADAWFDMTTAAAGPEFAVAVAMAVCAELPLAVVCGLLAVRR
ncbi:hypothetical protein ACWCP6_01935 [Streptomyces sp. NPDC002004]